MKFVFVGLFALLFIYQCSTTEAAAIVRRPRNYPNFEACPENSTEQECLNYANEQKNKFCRAFVITKKAIEWQFCARISCTLDGRELNTIQDHSKPYPGCCPKCDLSGVESPEKVAFSAVL